jgi:2-keto-4-pentenoate hydratase
MLNVAVGRALPIRIIGVARYRRVCGRWVWTGAVTAVHEVRPGQRAEARCDDNLAVTCTIEAAKTA